MAKYSLNGTTWEDLTGVSTNAARFAGGRYHYPSSFLPNANANGLSALRLHAWDRVIGVAGGIGNFTEFAQFRTFSTASATLGVNVLPVNDPQPSQLPTWQRSPSARHSCSPPLTPMRSTVADIDAAAETVQITISAGGGQFTLSTLTGSRSSLVATDRRRYPLAERWLQSIMH